MAKVCVKNAISFIFFGQPSFPRLARPVDKAPISMSWEEVTVRAGHKVLMEVDNVNALIVGDLQGVVGRQLSPTQNTYELLLLLFL